MKVSLQRHAYVTDLPENFKRYGLTDPLEIRFQSAHRDGFAPGFDWSTAADLRPGCQRQGAACPCELLVPGSGILTYSAPTGSVRQTSGSYDPSLTLIWTQAARRGYFVNEVVGATLTTLNGTRRVAWAPIIASGKVLARGITTFIEYAPTLLPDSSRITIIDGGFAFARGRLAQIDVRSGYLKDAAGMHTLFLLGYSFRKDHLLRRIPGSF